MCRDVGVGDVDLNSVLDVDMKNVWGCGYEQWGNEDMKGVWGCGCEGCGDVDVKGVRGCGCDGCVHGDVRMNSVQVGMKGVVM